jgi:hypothetical protein
MLCIADLTAAPGHPAILGHGGRGPIAGQGSGALHIVLIDSKCETHSIGAGVAGGGHSECCAAGGCAAQGEKTQASGHRAAASRGAVCAVVQKELLHLVAMIGQGSSCLGDRGALCVFPITRNRNGSEDADDGHHDHDFDQGKTGAFIALFQGLHGVVSWTLG